MIDRAAQFSAFKALTGLEDDLAETARVTDSRIELSEQELSILNEKFTRICQKGHPMAQRSTHTASSVLPVRML